MTEVFTISYSDVPGFPVGSSVAQIVVTITGTAGPVVQKVAPGTATVSFLDVLADTYTFDVHAEDASGTSFGHNVTGSFVVTAPATVTLSLPSSASTAQA